MTTTVTTLPTRIVEIDQLIALELDDNALCQLSSTDKYLSTILTDHFWHSWLSKYLGWEVPSTSHQGQHKTEYIALRRRSLADQLTSAARLGNPHLVRLFLDRGADMSANECQAVTTATRLNKLEVVKVFMDSGFGPPKVITEAAKCGHLEMVRYLIDQANPKPMATDLTAALTGAATNGYMSVVKLLLISGADKERAIGEATRCGSIELLQYVLELDPTTRLGDLLTDSIVQSPPSFTRYLIENMLTRFTRLADALDIAISYGKNDIATLLIDKVDPAALDINRALVVATRSGNRRVRRFILDNVPEAKNYIWASLLANVKRGYHHDIEDLIPFSTKNELNAALIVAVHAGNSGTVGALISGGANAHFNNDEAFAMAIRGGRVEIADILYKSGANIHIKDLTTHRITISAMQSLIGMGIKEEALKQALIVAIANDDFQLVGLLKLAGAY